MKTIVPHSRRARAFSLAAMIALVAMLLPAVAGIVQGHTPSASLTCVSGTPTLTVNLSNYNSGYTNKLWVTIDSVNDATYYNYSFGTGFGPHTWTLSPATLPHSATVVVLAGDDLHNVHGYSPTYHLSVPPCQKSSPNLGTTPSAGGLVGTVLNDTATLSGGYNPTGSITFNLFGPTTGTCDTTPIYTQVVALSGTSATTSPGFTTTAVGTYEWKASYPGDQYNNAATSGCGKEAVIITKNSPSISTKLSQSVTSIGNAVHDTATLSGATADAGGTVDYVTFSNNTCTAGATDLGAAFVTGGVVGESSSVSFSAAGTWYWQATYSGDAKNSGATSTCTEEVLTVNPNSPSISTKLSQSVSAIGNAVSDSASLSGATGNAGGTVTYTVYTNNTCSTGNIPAGTKTVTSGIVPDSSPITFNSAGTWYWQAVYSGDANNSAATSACESEVLTVNPNSPSISTKLSQSVSSIGSAVNDSATLSGATADAGGTVTYTVYTNNTCSTGAIDAGTNLTVAAGIVPDSNPITFNSAGTWYWQAVYSGDANNSGATSECESEVLTVNPNSPSITTKLSESSGVVGDTVFDTASLSSATADAGGTVTYTVYTNNTCSTGAIDAGTVAVAAGVVPNSNPITFNTAGTWYWQASYSGDANNNAAMSTCNEETLIINKSGPTIETNLSRSSGVVGDSAHDGATLFGATPDAGGTVTYTVYSDNECSLGARDAGTKTVTAGIVPDSNPITFNTAGTWYWQAVYSGDANNAPATSTCRSETLQIDPSRSPFQSFQGETATPGVSKTPFQSVEGATATPATPPPTSSSGDGSSSNSTPLFALLISLVFGGLGLAAVQAQRRSIRR